MNGYNFTERVRRALAYSREEAVRLRHEYVGTEHILLGLLREGEGVASTVLANLDIDAERLGHRLEAVVMAGERSRVTGPDLPYTSRAKKALELAMSEARELHHSYVGTEHLLLGLLREEKGIAAQVLVEAGLSLDAARHETLRILGSEGGDEEAPVPKPSRLQRPLAAMRADAKPRADGDPSRVVIELQFEDGWRLRRTLPTVRDAMMFLANHPRGV